MFAFRARRVLFLLLGLVLFLPACGSDGGSASIGTNPQSASQSYAVHEFTYDPVAKTYTVVDKAGTTSVVTHDDVQRDLAGSLCSRCHTDAVDDLKASVHYSIAARTDRVLFPGGGAHGMLDRACGLPATTGLTNSISDINLGECAKCHVGRYLPVMEGMFTMMFDRMGLPNAQTQAKSLVDGGLDCLICHSETYKSRPMEGTLAAIAGTASPTGHSPTAVGVARDSRDNADFNHDGVPDLVLDMNGDGVLDAPLMMDTDGDGQPDTPWPTVAQDRSVEAIAGIGPTTSEHCLRCHEHARTGYKRGTLFLDGHDIHAGSMNALFTDGENRCTVCHATSHHKFVRGHSVGGDLAAADYPPPPPGSPPNPHDPTDLTCTKCHDTAALSEDIHRERHLSRIACETCHIPYGSGITYSLFGHGGQISFARNAEGKDTKLVVADMYVAGDRADIDADAEAFKGRPIFTWFDGGTSFLAQTMAVRGMPNAKITPFKPMANGMVFDARYFNGAVETNEAGFDYNAHSMYRFYANGNNAEAFYALDMLDMTPTEVRNVTFADFQNPDPRVQAMALMLIFPNLVYFDKASFGYEHYLTRTGSPFDANLDGVIDVGADASFDMHAASNDGLRKFQGFNAPMGFPAEYEWYPPFDDASQTISMKLPDGSLIKMFLQMQGAKLPAQQREAFMQAVADYPAFSQVTLGGHGVQPANKAIGASLGCVACHAEGGALAHPVPVGRKTPVDMGPMGTIEMPLYRWRFYKVSDLIQLGLSVTSEEILAGTKNVDIDGNTNYLRDSKTSFVLNWFAPNDPSGYRPADAESALEGTGLAKADLTWHGGKWMPVLEPVTDLVPNYKVLGYTKAEIIWAAK